MNPISLDVSALTISLDEIKEEKEYELPIDINSKICNNGCFQP
jgi:hypothetical protein